MALEMDPDLTPQEAIETLQLALGYHHRIFIPLPEEGPEDALARGLHRGSSGPPGW